MKTVTLPNLKELDLEELKQLLSSCNRAASVVAGEISYMESKDKHRTILQLLEANETTISRAAFANAVATQFTHQDDYLKIFINDTNVTINRLNLERVKSIMAFSDIGKVHVFNFYTEDAPAFAIFMKKEKHGLVKIGKHVEEVVIVEEA